MEIRAQLAKTFDLGATAQATVPGAYAWAVTVAPAAIARGAPSGSKWIALAGVTFLALAPLIERRRADWGRVVSVWGLVGTSLVVWVLAPTTWTSPKHPDVTRTLAGVVGWLLFAIASVAPPIPRREQSAVIAPPAPLPIRGKASRMDWVVLLLGIGLAAALQGIGWDVDEPERGVLIRLVALAGGVMLIGAAGALVAARHAEREWAPPARRAKRAALALVLFGLWVTGGALYTIAR